MTVMYVVLSFLALLIASLAGVLIIAGCLSILDSEEWKK